MLARRPDDAEEQAHGLNVPRYAPGRQGITWLTNPLFIDPTIQFQASAIQAISHTASPARRVVSSLATTFRHAIIRSGWTRSPSASGSGKAAVAMPCHRRKGNADGRPEGDRSAHAASAPGP